jgi:hypothetical protein
MIDVSAATIFGNMTSGAGLNTIFDGDSSTGGYYQGTVGYAGVSLTTASTVASAEFVSANQGFDGSGLTTDITLKLFGKNGASPIGPYDGTLLGQESFVDQNTQRTITVTSGDTTTEYAHIWGVVECGVWAELKELRLYESGVVIPPPPAEIPYTLERTHVQVLHKTCNTLLPLTQAEMNVEEFQMNLEVPVAGSFDIDFVINVTHRGETLSPAYIGAVGIGARVKYKYAPAEAGLASASWEWLPKSATNGINIDERNPAHYANVATVSGLDAQAGFYQFSIFMSAHTDGTTQDYTAAILKEADGINGFRIRYTPGGEWVNMDDYNES